MSTAYVAREGEWTETRYELHADGSVWFDDGSDFGRTHHESREAALLYIRRMGGKEVVVEPTEA